MRMPMLKDLGHFPGSGPESREAKLFYHLKDDNEHAIRMISGKKTPALISLWVSNDVMQFGTIKVLTGGAGPQQTEWDAHKGDAVFHVLSGPMTFLIKDRVETYDVEEGDFMFIPAGEQYKILNFYGKTIEAVFSIAPEL